MVKFNLSTDRHRCDQPQISGKIYLHHCLRTKSDELIIAQNKYALIYVYIVPPPSSFNEDN